MEWFRKLSIDEKIDVMCEMYFDYGVKYDKELLYQAEEMKKIVKEELR